MCRGSKSLVSDVERELLVRGLLVGRDGSVLRTSLTNWVIAGFRCGRRVSLVTRAMHLAGILFADAYGAERGAKGRNDDVDFGV